MFVAKRCRASRLGAFRSCKGSRSSRLARFTIVPFVGHNVGTLRGTISACSHDGCLLWLAFIVKEFRRRFKRVEFATTLIGPV